MRKLRLEANWMNMVIALLACVLIMVLALMIAPQPKGDPIRKVDAEGIGKTADDAVEWPVAWFETPQDWHSNEARLGPMGEPSVETWYASYVGPDEQWLSIRQAQAEEDWAKSFVKEFAPVGEQNIQGVKFATYEGKNREQAFVGQANGTWFVVQAVATGESGDMFVKRALEKH